MASAAKTTNGSEHPRQPDLSKYPKLSREQAGITTDPDLKALRAPWADPIARENVMYSGHLLMMVSLYAMLFDDDEFEAPGVLRAAWDEKGLLGPDGLFPDFWMVRQDVTLPARDPAWTAWGCAFMNAWNGAFVRSHFDEQSLGHVTKTEGEVRLNQPPVAAEFRKLVKEQGGIPDLARDARDGAPERKRNHAGRTRQGKWPLPVYQAYVRYADRNLNPTWERGGLYYPRNDQRFDSELEWTHMDPFSGNAAIGYARLNVEDGQRIMWERPWTAEAVASRPFVDGITLGDGVDFPRGDWDRASGLLVLTVRTWDGAARTIRPVVKGLEAGPWNVFVGGELAVSRVFSAGEDIALEVQVGGADLDIVVVKRV
ncbi:hypothetical protein CSUB01_03220 [Colletotrichum sublineola]|uniref:Linalool dehydratase/isomerase domain-containing protein n=1 Tax=Colletotrichum sublineola TaxID=1173701 RepID=A0A066WSN2_COLSU|nr:hypothetical protein CSUB01_03220 [Colletotrichum sublineola]